MKLLVVREEEGEEEEEEERGEGLQVVELVALSVVGEMYNDRKHKILLIFCPSA